VHVQHILSDRNYHIHGHMRHGPIVRTPSARTAPHTLMHYRMYKRPTHLVFTRWRSHCETGIMLLAIQLSYHLGFTSNGGS